MSIQSTTVKSLLLILSLTIFIACQKAEQKGPAPCSIATVPATLSFDETVYYAAVDSGAVTVTSITYKDSLGVDVKVSNPTLPFSITVNAKQGSAVGIALEATTPVGSKVQAGYQYGPPNDPTTKVVGCSN